MLEAKKNFSVENTASGKLSVSLDSNGTLKKSDSAGLPKSLEGASLGQAESSVARPPEIGENSSERSSDNKEDDMDYYECDEEFDCNAGMDNLLLSEQEQDSGCEKGTRNPNSKESSNLLSNQAKTPKSYKKGSLILCYENFNEHDLGNDESPLRKKFDSIVKDLKEKNGTHQGRIKTMSGGDFPCLRAKLSSDSRLLFTRTKYNNEDAFIMLEVIPGHEYKKSKYNNSKFFRDVCKITEIKVEVIEGEVIKKLSCTVKTKDLRENLQQGHWLGKLVTFSAKQEEIVENAEGKYNLPLIISGSAGSGKTSVALEKLRKIEEEFKKEEKCKGGKKKKILYITQSGSLIKESKKLYGYCDEAAGEIPQRIEFLSVHEFIERVTKEDRKRVEGKRPINRNAFFHGLMKFARKRIFVSTKKTEIKYSKNL